MLKRELIRISLLCTVGLLVMLFILLSEGYAIKWPLLIPLYVLGTFYASKILLKILGKMARTFFSCQIMSFLINPLWGSIICMTLLAIGLAAIFSFGWLIGICRCIYSLIVAYRIDTQCMEPEIEYY